MMIGLMFASIYAAMDRLQSAPFFANGSPANSRTFQYFSFATLTTTGYGDFTAGTNSGRAIAVMEALGGQIFLATLVARLVASYRSPRRTAMALGDTGPIGDTGPSGGHAEAAPAPDPPAVAGQPWNGRTRRGNSNRPRAGRAPPVKWRRARHR
jgi:hypothetical protein